MTDPDHEARARAQRVLALPPPAEADEHGETISPFDNNGEPDLSDVSPRYLRELARTHTRDALETLLDILHNRDSSDTAKIACAKELLARGWGTPSNEADILRIWLAANAPPLPDPEPDKPLRFVMPMTVDRIDQPDPQDP